MYLYKYYFYFQLIYYNTYSNMYYDDYKFCFINYLTFGCYKKIYENILNIFFKKYGIISK